MSPKTYSCLWNIKSPIVNVFLNTLHLSDKDNLKLMVFDILWQAKSDLFWCTENQCHFESCNNWLWSCTNKFVAQHCIAFLLPTSCIISEFGFGCISRTEKSISLISFAQMHSYLILLLCSDKTKTYINANVIKLIISAVGWKARSQNNKEEQQILR